MVLSAFFLEYEVLTSLEIISDDRCGRNRLKLKVSTVEELLIFSQKILKNYIARCDFWAGDIMSTASVLDIGDVFVKVGKLGRFRNVDKTDCF